MYRTHNLKLFEVSNLAKSTGSIDVKGEGRSLFLDDPGHLIGEVNGSLRRQKITDAETMSNNWAHLCHLPPQKRDLCFIRNKNKMLLFMTCPEEVSARDQNGRVIWSFSGAPTGMGRDIRPTSITVDQEEQKLYVCDSANQCIQIISTNGVYQGRLVKRGEYGLGTPTISRWCKDGSFLLIFIYKNDRHYASILKIKSHKEHVASSSWLTFLHSVFCFIAFVIIINLLLSFLWSDF